MMLALVLFFLLFFSLTLLLRWRSLRAPNHQGSRRLWWHFQNLNDLPGDRQGSMLRTGRAWLYLDHYVFRVEWHFFHWTFCKLGVAFGDYEDSITFTCSNPLFSLYLGLEGVRPGLFPEGRECSLAIHDNALWINPWSRSDEWHARDPWWVRGLTLHLDDLLLGTSTHTRRILRTQSILVPMPEGTYPATATLFESTWKRPRWFTERLVRCDITVPGGIPMEGKGENSWDCGEDAVYSLTCPAHTIEEAIGQLVTSVLRSRQRYGGALTHRDLPIFLAPARPDYS
jgi:hypothetical protein